MTSTYIPTERDERFDNANLTEKDSMFDQSSRMGFFHYYNSLFWRMTADHFELTGETHLLTELKAQTFVKQADHMFCTALDPKFIGLKPVGDPDGSAKLLGQGPIRMIDYWQEVKKHMVTALPQPQRGHETDLTVVGGNLLCLGATKSPVKNIASLVRETHTFDPDKFIACRGATLDDIADIVEDVMNPYKGTLPRFFTKGEPDGSAYRGVRLKTRKETQRAPTGMYPGTIVVVLDG